MDFLSLNAVGMKNHNKYAVLKYIRKGYLSRADISRLTNLTRASITYIVDDLREAGLVIEGEYKQKRVGKRSIQLSINPKAGYAIGISITRDCIQLNVINLACEVVKSDVIYDKDLSLGESLDAISEKVASYIKKYSRKMLGIGIICPGPVDEINGKIINPIKLNKWHYFDICEYFSNRFKIKCFLKKDINSYALIEKTFNKDIDGCDFLDVISDRGIGSSVILDGKLLVGNGFGVELGHVSIDPINGKLCQCGLKGCVEQYASTSSIINYCKEQGLEYNKWEEVMDDFLSNDETKRNKAKDIVDKMVFYYGEALSTFENILNIGTIIITGSLSYRSEVLFDSIENYINSHILAKNLSKVRIVRSIIEDIEYKAAGNIVLEELFNGNLN